MITRLTQQNHQTQSPPQNVGAAGGPRSQSWQHVQGRNDGPGEPFFNQPLIDTANKCNVDTMHGS